VVKEEINTKCKKCIRCKKTMIEDFDKWKQENPTKIFAYCRHCRMMIPVMRDVGVDI